MIIGVLKNLKLPNISVILLSDHILHHTLSLDSTAILTLPITRCNSNFWFPKAIIDNPFLAYGIFLAFDSVFRAISNYSVVSLFSSEFCVFFSFFRTVERGIWWSIFKDDSVRDRECVLRFRIKVIIGRFIRIVMIRKTFPFTKVKLASWLSAFKRSYLALFVSESVILTVPSRQEVATA